MKAIYRLTLLLSALACTFTACDKNDTPINCGSTDNTPKERVIIYSVGNNEGHRTLETEAEWDALLDQFCNQALSGDEVTFYNTSQTTYLHSKAHGDAKEERTINTTSRDEIKTWMKAMEKEGRTVRVTYDDNTGTWHGVAYATAPAENTEGNIIGTWHFNCMVVTHVDLGGQLLSSDLFAPEENGGSWAYTFAADGTLTITINGMDGTTATDSGTWSLSEDGVLCSELLPSGACWNVNWITPQTLIMTRADLGTEEGDIYYQLQFDRE